MAIGYYIDRNKKNLRKLNDLLMELPDICSVYFIGISNDTTPLTRVNYARDLKIFFNYLIEFEKPFMKFKIKDISVQDLDKIDSMMIERFLNYTSYYDKVTGQVRTNTELGKSRKLSAVRSFLKFFFDKNLILSNVATKVKTPKIHSKAIIRLEDDEMTDIIDRTESLQGFSLHQQKYNDKLSLRDTAIVTLFLGTGIRVSECVGLNVEDINFSNHSFKVIRKGGNESILYFNEEVEEALKNYLILRESYKLPDSEHALFVSIQKKRMGVRAMEKLITKYARISTPLKRISPHKLRSTFGTNLYRSTNDIYVVAEVLGHKDVNTTKKHYADISEDIKKKASTSINLRK